MIETNGEREFGKSVRATCHDDDHIDIQESTLVQIYVRIHGNIYIYVDIYVYLRLYT